MRPEPNFIFFTEPDQWGKWPGALMPKSVELKNTLNLPKTAFPMKANLPQNEPAILSEWEATRVYERILQSRKGAPVFVLHDGPPYANDNVHLGTATNKILKDFIVKSRTMMGYRAPYVPGWDCHGLPIEIKVDQDLRGRKATMSAVEIRRACREHASRFVELHRRDFKRLGIFGQWDDPYLTMSNQYEALIAETFLKFMEKGSVYRGLKPVYWCVYDETALAEAEVEYEDHTSPSIWVRYKLARRPTSAAAKETASRKQRRLHDVPSALQGREVFAITWTTTPWTLPASMALAFHPEFDYAAVETDQGLVYLVADQLREAVASQCGFQQKAVLATFKGSELDQRGLVFEHPFVPQDHKYPNSSIETVSAEYVTLDVGTGIVHTAPGHGAEDYMTGLKYGLQTYCPVDNAGRFTEGLPEYVGQRVFDANEAIIDLLRKHGALLASENLKHSYPHCWRCHNPVIFRATEQWFISMEHDGLRERALEEIARVKWLPEWGKERIASMVNTRPDWCISRQRVWGVPLIVFYCQACEAPLEDMKALRQVVRWFEKEGADAWFAHSSEELLPRGTRCAKCGGSRFRKEKDILDVWFDSGSSHLAVLGHGSDLPWPSDVYIEGADQYRGWFHSSLLIAVGTKGRAPYRTVISYGWVLDAQGRPMSKSLGNVILPREICDKYGAEMLRLWVASLDCHDDMWWSDESLARLGEAYRKIRNTFRICLANLYDFDPARHLVAPEHMLEVDRWIQERAAQLVRQSLEWYEGYTFHKVYHAIHDFCAVDLSALYVDISKDRLYTFAPESLPRRSAQTALFRIADALIRLAAPFMIFTTEEAWKYLPKRAPATSERQRTVQDTVHAQLFPKPEELATGLGEDRVANWDRLLAVRTEVLRALETARKDKIIGSGLDAKIYLRVNSDLEPLLASYREWLPMWFIVSQVELGREHREGAMASEIPGLEISVSRADGTKCERCWTYSTRVGEFPEHPTICERCVTALAEIEAGPAHGRAGSR